MHVRSWQYGYRGLLPDSYLDSLKPEERAARYDFDSSDPRRPATLVAVARGAVCGFATTAPARDTGAMECGELAGLYVDPDHWGRGIGAALLAAVEHRLTVQGFSRALLWVLEGNARAERFYLRQGWQADGGRRTEEIWGVAVRELRYHRSLG